MTLNKEKTYKTYRSWVGDHLFPASKSPHDNHAFYEQEANNFVSELLYKEKSINTAGSLLKSLETFIPESIQDAIDDKTWATEQIVGRWENMIKIFITKRVNDIFLDLDESFDISYMKSEHFRYIAITKLGIAAVRHNDKVMLISELDPVTLSLKWSELKEDNIRLYEVNEKYSSGWRGFILKIIGVRLPIKDKMIKYYHPTDGEYEYEKI